MYTLQCVTGMLPDSNSMAFTLHLQPAKGDSHGGSHLVQDKSNIQSTYIWNIYGRYIAGQEISFFYLILSECFEKAAGPGHPLPVYDNTR